MKQTADVIVAGLGAMGSAALYQLAKKGVKAIGIDQYTPPHNFGSSHGDTRIIRKVAGQAIEYTPLALRAYDIWRELEQATHQKLMTLTGGLIVEANNSLSASKPTTCMPTIQEAAKLYKVPHEILSAKELVKRFPQFRFHDNEQGYFEPDAGYLRPELCVDVQLSLARKQGAQINFNERITNFTALKDGSVSVVTDKGEYAAQKLIVSTGPWISHSFPQYQNLFKVCRQVMYWFDVPGDITPYGPDNLPIFIFELADGNALYGFPAIDGPKGGLKIGVENHTILTTPNDVDRTIDEAETKIIYEEYVRPTLPGLSRDCVKAVSCLYTLTPDLHFIIDTVPDAPQIIMASPCSGHGFKYSAAIGEALAEMAMGQKTSVNLDKFKLARLLDDKIRTYGNE
jgi:sarcosine oxidase